MARISDEYDLDKGCQLCHAGDALELEQGAGVVLEGMPFHMDCLGEWMEEQGWTEVEQEVAYEQVYG